MKASIFDYTRGKAELETMDDILPLVIYTVWYWKWPNFAAEINFVKDYLHIASSDEADEAMERTLVNLEMGIQYVNTSEEYPFAKE